VLNTWNTRYKSSIFYTIEDIKWHFCTKIKKVKEFHECVNFDYGISCKNLEVLGKILEVLGKFFIL
jgi:hypothetical protein